MGDYGCGLLATNISTLLDGRAFRSYAFSSPVSLGQLRPDSPLSSVAESPLFLSAAAHLQNMQDEPVGVTTTQRPPSIEENNSNINIINKTGKQLNRTDYHCSQLGSFTSDCNHLKQNQDFSDFDQDHFCPTQSICDLQHDRKIHQQLSQHIEFSSTELPPPQGKLSHLPQRQPFTKPVHNADPCPIGISGSPVEETDADAASPSPTSVNPSKIQMDSPITHHINNGNGSSTGNMLSGGLGAGFPNLQNQEMQNPSGGSASPPLPGFGTPWSVQTSSSPPPVPNSVNPIHANAINQIPNTESDNSFYPGIPSSINPAFFHSFSPVSANPCAGINVQGFSGPFSPQINVPQQPQSRRSPVSPQMHPQQGAFLQQRNNYNHHQVSYKRKLLIILPSIKMEIIDYFSVTRPVQ